MNLKKYNLQGDEIGVVSFDDSLLQESANTQMVKDYLVAYRANQRQWSANTKTRAEVNHSGKKPHPQKGTGRARQGYLGAPQYKGGGRVFGPRPKFDQQVRLNKKEKRAVIRSLIAEKVREQRMYILSLDGLDKPKTKVVVDFLKKLGLAQKRVLFLGEDLYEAKERGFLESCVQDMDADVTEKMEAQRDKEFEAVVSAYERREVMLKSLRNVSELSFHLVPNVNGYDLALHQDIVLLEGATEQLFSLLGGGVL